MKYKQRGEGLKKQLKIKKRILTIKNLYDYEKVHLFSVWLYT